jgi:hypothetical protein
LNDQIVALLVEPLAGIINVGGAFLQNSIGGDHFPRDQILPDAEMFERALGLRAPELVGWNIYFAETVSFLANFCHVISPF